MNNACSILLINSLYNFPRRGRKSYKNTRGVLYNNTRGAPYKNTRGVSYKKNTRGVLYNNTRGVPCNSTRGVSRHNTRGVYCKILEVIECSLEVTKQTELR